jgi:hypothetical protein
MNLCQSIIGQVKIIFIHLGLRIHFIAFAQAEIKLSIIALLHIRLSNKIFSLHSSVNK